MGSHSKLVHPSPLPTDQTILRYHPAVELERAGELPHVLSPADGLGNALPSKPADGEA